MKVAMFIPFALFCICHLASAQVEGTNSTKLSAQGKVLSVFNVVRFPNELCNTGSSKNGTCYTTSECSSRGGTGSGSCANGYGVCCTFTLGCGGKSSENSTYFDSASTVNAGLCKATICKVNSDICQLRIDFNNFVISGPSTATTSNVKVLAGNVVAAGGFSATTRSRCLTDYFSVASTGGSESGVICGLNSGQHIFVDASNDCNMLAFHLGQSGIGTKLETRSWSLKISQLSCLDPNLPPAGCTQYYFGATTGSVQSFNFDATTKQHLANQNQKICFRRERGLCRLCFYSAAKTDFQISGTVATMGGFVKAAGVASKCCGYGTTGIATAKGYDCVVLPGASNGKQMQTRLASSRACGVAFASTSSMTQGAIAGGIWTVCTKQTPFSLDFVSDNFEALAEVGTQGFKLAYFQDATGC